MWIELTFIRGDKHMVNTDHVSRVTEEAETHRAIIEFRSLSIAVKESYEEIKKLLGSANPLVGPVKRADPVYVDTAR